MSVHNGTLFLIILGIDIVLFILTLFMVMNVTDLDSDIINPIDCCKELNTYVWPEFYAHGLLTLLTVYSGSIFSIILVMPIFAYNMWRFINQKVISDPTSIYRGVSIAKKNILPSFSFIWPPYFIS
ncbi:hypothetical protein DSO57_1020475 [Entomophthora muscae]|uniref:Uncharacterized protein n=2 Tax=Entomophthora muscae TaxID=34485 RepID=A0ACC2TEU5_9FUNG|nr:hypothetical protein DSO57_1020475 [Entomophthora muscae]